jgi:hypothetical protein
MQPKHVAVLDLLQQKMCTDEQRPYYCVLYKHDGDITP